MISVKNILQTDFEGKNRRRKYLGEKYPALKKIYISLMAYNAENKILLRYMLGKKIQAPEVLEKSFNPN